MNFFGFFRSPLILVSNVLVSVGLSSQKNKTANKTTGNYAYAQGMPRGEKENEIKTTNNSWIELVPEETTNETFNSWIELVPEETTNETVKSLAEELQNLFATAKVSNEDELKNWLATNKDWLADARVKVTNGASGVCRNSLKTILGDIARSNSIRLTEWLINLFKFTVAKKVPPYTQGVGEVLASLEEMGRLRLPKVLNAEELNKVQTVMRNYNEIVMNGLTEQEIGAMDYDTLANWLEKNGAKTEAAIVRNYLTNGVEDVYVTVNGILQAMFIRIKPLLEKFAPLFMRQGVTAKQILIEELKCLKSLINEK